MWRTQQTTPCEGSPGRCCRNRGRQGGVSRLQGWRARRHPHGVFEWPPATATATSQTSAGSQFNNPAGLAVDGTGRVYVGDAGNGTVRRISGNVATTFAGAGANSEAPTGWGSRAFQRADSRGEGRCSDLYVSDTGNDTIRKLTPGGVLTTLAGTAASRKRQRSRCRGAIQRSRRRGAGQRGQPLRVGHRQQHDPQDHAGRHRFDPAGTPGQAGNANGPGVIAQFNHPEGLAVDGAGNIYVADTLNDLIRKITPQGVVSTLSGSAGQTGNTSEAGDLSLSP